MCRHFHVIGHPGSGKNHVFDSRKVLNATDVGNAVLGFKVGGHGHDDAVLAARFVRDDKRRGKGI